MVATAQGKPRGIDHSMLGIVEFAPKEKARQGVCQNFFKC